MFSLWLELHMTGRWGELGVKAGGAGCQVVGGEIVWSALVEGRMERLTQGVSAQ